MTGWRIGYGAGPAELIERMIKLQGHSTSGPPGICQRAAHAALTGPTDDLERMRAAFTRRRAAMVDLLCKIPDVTCPTPEGAFYCLPDLHAFFGRRHHEKAMTDACTLAEALLEHAKAAVVPGDAFGAPYALRFSYACSEAAIRSGMDRVTSFLTSLR